MWLFVRLTVICLLIAELQSALSSLRLRYRVTDKAPETMSLTNSSTKASSVEDCLMTCSRTEQCQSVVFDDGSCILYDTTVGTRQLTGSQIALSEVYRTAAYDNYLWMKQLVLREFGGCAYSSADSGKTCDMLYDGDLSTAWVAPTDSIGQWATIYFNEVHTVCAVTVFSHRLPGGQCSELTFTFDTDVAVKMTRQCVEVDGQAIDSFEFGAVNTTSLKMTCSADCSTGWKTFYEIVIYIYQ